MSWQQQQQQPYGAGGFQPQQTGFQPQQTGFQPQQTGFQQQQTGFQPQQTGFQSQQPRFMSAQQTGFPGQQFGGLQSQQTGYPSFQSQGLAPPLAQQSTQRPQNTGGSTGAGAGNYAFLNAPPPSSSMGGMQPQQTGWQGGLSSQPTGYGGGGHSGLLAQPTGAPSRLMAQPTGMPHDPRLQMMSAHFMPGNTSAPFSSSGAPSLPAPLGGQTSFQSLLSNPTVNTPKVPWTLSKQEKKDYDQIFRAWDQTGDGFINGDMAREVFGQSGLGRDDLMKIWNLSDVDNRGKLNLPEFHIAMGLIYRALNGNTIPDTLPEELIPPSMRDIDTTVTFMRDLLRHDASSRSTTSSPGFGYGSSTPNPAGASKDAKVYKHDDSRTSSGYKSSSRHLDRKSVRYAGEDSGAELGDLKRQLANSSAQLDQSADEFARRTEEDEALEQEVEDLKYRVKRVKDDIDYVSKGKRTPEKDEERRKLERELLYLMHEKLPEVERKQEENELRKKRDERAGARARDRRNETYGRKDYTSDRDRERDEYRGTFERERDYERERERERDYRDRDRPRSRSREHDRRGSYDRRPRSPIATSRTPPPEPEAPSKSNHIAVPPPAPPKPTASTPAAPSTKNMTPEERTAFIRAQAQKRIQDRLKALGVETAQPDAPAVDKSVEDRLAREKQEAEEKLKAAESEQAAREDARKKRLEAAGGPPEAPKPPVSSTSASKPPPAPPSKSAMKKPPPAPVPRSQKSSAAAPAPVTPAPALDPEDEELRQREEARAKASAERKARLKKLEEEEEEERRKEEEYLASRKAKSAPKDVEAPAPPPAPPAPPAPSDSGSYNPFHRKTSASGAVTSPPSAVPAAGGFNPFFRPPAASPALASPVTSPPPPPPPAPPAPSAPAPAAPQQPRSAVAPAPEEDWDVIAEKDDDSDSSDDDYANSRGARGNLARALFGNILPPTSRPTSAGPGSASPTSAPAPPPAPKMPPAALANLGGATPADPSARGALFASIQGGAKLRKAVTVDKSGPQVSGRVVGDAGPPEHITAALSVPRSPSPVEESYEEAPTRNANRQSVDWYAGLATDTSHPSADYQPLETTKEEQSPVQENGHQEAAPASEELEDPTAEFDMDKDIRVRTLYPYDGQRDVDLSFIENVVIVAHPAKDPESPWWYGTLVEEGRSGWFPHAYVEEMKSVKAKALYAYAGGGQEELPFEENDVLDIVDHSDNDWWKTEKAGVVFIVPAAYLELQG